MFFKRQPKESPDDLANRLQQEGKIEMLEDELKRYNPQKLGKKEKESYYHLWGISAFQRGDRPAAYERFREGNKACPESKEIIFSLGQEHEARKEINEMIACFNQCSFPDVSSQFMLAAARYAYLWDRPKEGMQYLKKIIDAYFQLGIADDHFVYVRGLPFFGQTWSYLVAFAWMKNDYSFTDDILTRSKKNLSDYDFERLERLYLSTKKSDYSEYILELEESLKQHDAQFPSGYQKVQIESLRVHQGGETSELIRGLDSIDLESNDFPWLEDIIRVQKAKAYWKAGMSSQERKEKNEFFEHQRMLFEPDHAINFAFIDYQETLKPLYQK